MKACKVDLGGLKADLVNPGPQCDRRRLPRGPLRQERATPPRLRRGHDARGWGSMLHPIVNLRQQPTGLLWSTARVTSEIPASCAVIFPP